MSAMIGSVGEIHVAAEGEHALDARRVFHGQGHADDRAVAPTNHRGFLNIQSIHYGRHVGRHKVVGERSIVTRTATLPTAIDENDAMTFVD
jgi:hypothetical protein